MNNLLIVEDNKTNADVLSRRLGVRGYRTTVAENGQIGVDLALTLKPDLILMDIGMPELDGIEATRALKANPLTQNIPIIAVTASAFDSDRLAALEAGCDEFETKPVDLDSLIAKIKALLEPNASPSPAS